MAVHLEPLSHTMRWFRAGKEFGTDPFEAACTVLWLGPTEVFVCGLRGEGGLTLRDWRDARKLLMDLGVRRAWAIRNGEKELLYDVDAPHGGNQSTVVP